MGRIEEIEAAIDQLPPEEFRRIAEWVREHDQALWDKQLDYDSASGKLDQLFNEGDREASGRLLTDWPPSH